MREYQIKVEPFEYIALRMLKIEQKVNEHAKTQISMHIRDDRREPYMEILSGETWVKVIGLGKQEEYEDDIHTVLFYGIVTDFQVSYDGYETILNLEVTSGTILMDSKSHFRVFQNKDSMCAEICRKLTGTYKDGLVNCLEGENDKTGGVLIQYGETDWRFLKRILGRTGRYLVPDALKKGIQYTIGLPTGIMRDMQWDKMKMRLDMSEYKEKTSNGMPELLTADMLELIFTERDIYQLGDYIFYQGKEFFLQKIKTEYDKGECTHTYYFRTKKAIEVLPMPYSGLAGNSFDAIVTAIQKDRVQVDIMQDEWSAEDGKKWFLYSTVYSSADGTGWYCMPEQGDEVRLYVPEREEDSFIISSVHKPVDNSRQNPDYKSFKTKYGKEILFTPDTILLTNNQGMMIEMNDSKGITISSNRNIVIAADDNLTISSVNASLLLAASDLLKVNQGGTSMTLKDDIYFTGGEFRIQ